jgi:hypothetical protein
MAAPAKMLKAARLGGPRRQHTISSARRKGHVGPRSTQSLPTKKVEIFSPVVAQGEVMCCQCEAEARVADEVGHEERHGQPPLPSDPRRCGHIFSLSTRGHIAYTRTQRSGHRQGPWRSRGFADGESILRGLPLAELLRSCCRQDSYSLAQTRKGSTGGRCKG